MEDVLEVYQGDYEDDGILVCLDETFERQTWEARIPLPMRPGHPAAYGFGYMRNGTANPFMMTAPLEGWRHVGVTDHRTKRDFAETRGTWPTVTFRTGRSFPSWTISKRIAPRRDMSASGQRWKVGISGLNARAQPSPPCRGRSSASSVQRRGFNSRKQRDAPKPKVRKGYGTDPPQDGRDYADRREKAGRAMKFGLASIRDQRDVRIYERGCAGIVPEPDIRRGSD